MDRRTLKASSRSFLAAACVLAALVAEAGASQPSPAATPVVGPALAPPVRIEGLDLAPHAPLEFGRAWVGKAKAVQQRRAELDAAGRLSGMSVRALAEAGAALTGALRIPVIPLVYGDVDPPFGIEVLEDRLFGPNRGDTVSLAGYWSEVSNGMLRIEGEVLPWIRLDRPASHYLPAQDHGWARFGRIPDVWEEAIRKADGLVDFGAFDNDGQDGVPNSGDDDGFVDFVVFVFATQCNGDWRAGSIWPHRGAMPPLRTSARSADGSRIAVSDYVILPATETGSCKPMQVGVLAHEIGHAFGLPDLYDYDGASQGIGAWGLMGTGLHASPHSPPHLSAWSKERLGWVELRRLDERTGRIEVPPVVRDPVVYRYELPGRRGEYLLLENRRRLGSDRSLPGEGLLVWRVDPEQGAMGSWNTDERRPAVSLVHAGDRGNRAGIMPSEAAAPFPGTSRRHELEMRGDRPLRLSEIRERTDGTIEAESAIGHVRPTVVAEPGAVWMRSSAGDPPRQLVRVATRGHGPGEWSVRTAPSWLSVRRTGNVLMLEARPNGLAPGMYRDSVALQIDGEPAGRIAVHLSVPAAGAPEVVATRLTWSWGLAVRDGQVFQAGYGWDPLALRARPRLLHLLDGQTHPETLARLPANAIYSPVAAENGTYVLAHVQNGNYVYRVADDGTANLVASLDGGSPAYGAALLPDGSLVVGDWSGRLQRVTERGEVMPWGQLRGQLYQLSSDAAGNLYAAMHSGDIAHVDPEGGTRVIPTGFGRGRLVTVAAAPWGVYAAERGEQGRIVWFSPEGGGFTVAQMRGAAFFGLDLDGDYLYALDLAGRRLLRIDVAGHGWPVAAR